MDFQLCLRGNPEERRKALGYVVVGGSLSKNKGETNTQCTWNNNEETGLIVIHNAGSITWGGFQLQVKELGRADRHLRAGKWSYEIAIEQ